MASLPSTNESPLSNQLDLPTSDSASSHSSYSSSGLYSSPQTPTNFNNNKHLKKQISSPSVLGHPQDVQFSPLRLDDVNLHDISNREQHNDSKPLLEYVNTAQYILLLLIQQFERQAEIVIDNFAHDMKSMDVTTLVDSSVFSQAAPRSTSSWTNSNSSVLASTSGFTEVTTTTNDYESADPTSTATSTVSARQPIDNTSTTTSIQINENPENDLSQNAYMDQFYRLNSTKEKSDDNKTFEKLLAAFATVSKHSLNPTIEALYDWRVHLNTKPTQQVKERVEEQFRFSTRRSSVRQEAMLTQYTERKEVAADYVFCLALLLVLGSFHQPEITQKNSEMLETMCIERLKRANSYFAGASTLLESKKKVLDLLAEIIGILSIKRFGPITERFYQDIKQRIENSALKQEAPHLIRGLKYIKIKLGRPDHVVETVTFMKRLYESCLVKGKRTEIKVACYEAGANILSPLAAYQYKTGIDYRDWLEVLKNFLTYSTKSGRKNKYYLTAYPFISTILCLSSAPVFLKHFPSHSDQLIKYMQREPSRLMALDCMIHVLGYYLEITNEQEKTVFDRLQKTSQAVLSGKKNIPTPTNDPIYDAVVDIVVMIANKKLDFAMKHMVIECLKADYNSENVYIGLRAFLTIANQADFKKLQNSALEDDKGIEYPPWVMKLLQRTQSIGSVDSEEENGTTTIRIHSPFSSFRATSSTTNMTRNISFGTSFSGMRDMGDKFLEETGIDQYQEQLSYFLSGILQNCDANFGQLLIINQTRPLHETLSKERFGSLRVFVTAFSCVPRLLPNQYTPKQLTDMLCRCVIHQHKELRDVAWDVMCQLMDYHADVRAFLIHSFAEMVQRIGDFRTQHLQVAISKFIALLSKWIDNIHPSKIRDHSQTPTIYGCFNKNYDAVPFEVGLVESLGLILLCNLDPTIRLSALQIFIHTRTITSQLMLNEGRQLEVTTVADLLDEVGYSIVKKIWRKDKFCPPTLEQFIANPENASSSYNYMSDFLREFAQYVSDFCLPTANIALIQITKRINKIDSNLDVTYSRLPVSSDTKQLICLWRNFINFSCSVVSKHMFYEKSEMQRRNSRGDIQSSEGLFESVIKHLKCNCDIQLQAAVNALGGVRPDMLEVLLLRLAPLENEAYLDRQKKIKKRKDALRIQLARVYARMTSTVSDHSLGEKSIAVDRFLAFIEEQYSYLTNPLCMYTIELLSLRYNFFIIIEHVARKLYYVHNKGLDLKTRAKIMRYTLQWTGYGEDNSKRESEEVISLQAAMEKSKDAEEKKHIGNMYRMKSANIKSRACYAVAALLLGDFFDTNIADISEWSKQTRMNYKLHFENPHDDIDTDSDGKNSQKNKTTKTNMSLRSNLPTLGLGINLWDIGGRHKSDSINDGRSESQDSLPVTIFKWIDEILSSKDRSYRRIGIQAIENLLMSNPSLLGICIDQCYHCNARISFGYFTGIVQVFNRIELEHPLHILLVLVMHQSISDYTSARDDALKLLHLISSRYFEEDSESGNYPYTVSSDLLDHYRDLQTTLANKLARDHPQFSHGILTEVYTRLAYLPAENQRLLLKCLEPWITSLSLPDADENKNVEVVKPEIIHPKTESILDMLFDITYTYGGEFPKETEAIWVRLAKEKPNVLKVVNYLVNRGTSFQTSDFQKMFSISQKICVYCANTLAQYTVNCLVSWLKKMRDICPVGQHIRELSPNVESMTSDMTQSRMKSKSDGVTIQLARSDVVLILLVEIAYEHSHVFKKHLPLILQYLFIRMDHKTSIVSNSAKLLLVHLVHNFVIRNIPHNTTDNKEMEHLMAANRLIQHILDHHSDSSLWVRDKISIDSNSLNYIAASATISFLNDSDTHNGNTHNGRISKNVEQLSYLVESVESVFRNESEFKEGWGHEALRWATRSSSLHNVVRSYQIFRTLRPKLRQKDFINILHDISKYFEETLEENISEEDPNSPISRETIKTAVTIEIIDTLRVIVRHMDEQRLILFPQIFWLCAALLNSDVIYIYVHSMKLLTEVFDHLDMNNDSVLSVLIASKPKDLGLSIFPGLQPLVMRGLTNPYAEPLALDLISRFSLLPVDSLFDPSEPRMVMNITALLPLLCLSIRDDDMQKCMKIAENLAEACEQKKLKKIAKVFLRYSKGYYDTKDKFLLDIRKPFCDSFFPQHEEPVFNLLIELLQFGPPHYQKPVLSILHSLLLYVDVANSNLGHRERLINTTATLLKGPLWRDSTRVLDVAVRSASKGIREQIQLLYNNSIQKTADYSEHKTFSSIAGNGTKQCIAFIRKILQQLKEQNEKLSDSDIHLRKSRKNQSTLMDLFDNVHAEEQMEQMHPSDFDNIDISTLATNMDASEDSTTEESEFTEDLTTDVTDTDLLTTNSSRYRLTIDFENAHEEDTEILKLFNVLLENHLKLLKPSTPYAGMM